MTKCTAKESRRLSVAGPDEYRECLLPCFHPGDSHQWGPWEEVSLLSRAPESLEEWWRQLTEQDITDTMPKMAEYTSADLVIMGQTLQEWMPGDQLNTAAGQEMAVMFYLLGKIARAVAAYREGRLPSEDTLKDIRIYAVMAQRIRETGEWSST